MTVGLACGPLRPGGCGRFLGVVAQPWTTARTGTSKHPVPFYFSLISPLTHALHQRGFNWEANIRGNRICFCKYRCAPSLLSLFPFVRYPAGLLTCLLCYSAVATCRRCCLGRRSWRRFVMAASCAVSRGPVSPSFPDQNDDTHRLCSPSSSSRCKSDGFLGLCGLVQILSYMCFRTILAA